MWKKKQKRQQEEEKRQQLMNNTEDYNILRKKTIKELIAPSGIGILCRQLL